MVSTGPRHVTPHAAPRRHARGSADRDTAPPPRGACTGRGPRGARRMVGFRHLFLVSSLRQFLGSICELDGLRLQLRTVTMRSVCVDWAFPWAAAVTRAPERCSAGAGGGGACLSLVYGELVALLLNLESGFVRIGHGARLQRLGLLVRLLWAAEALLGTRRQGSAPLSFPFGGLGAFL